MNKKNEFDGIYNIDIERILLSFLIEDADVFVRCRNILKDVYFDEQLRRAVRFILSHTDEHKAIPNPLLIQAKTGVEIKRLADFGEIMNEDWFLDEITKFCRYKEFEIIINESYDLLQKGEEANIESRVKEAMAISLVSDLGLDYFDDPKTRLQGMLDRPNLISTGYKSIDDKLYGGFEIGGLNIFYGLPNAGKSLILQNLALNWSLMGHTVIYFTMEMSKESIAVRVDAMLTGKSTKEVFHSIDDTALLITMRGKKAGRLQFAKMKDSGTTVNDLRSYLKEFQIKTELKPDCLVIDYLDIMHPTDKSIPISDAFNKDKAVSEEIRGLMNETGTFGGTASQIGRSGIEAQGDFSYTNVAGGISKVNTADNIIYINAPPHMKEKGEYEIIFGKTRTSAAVGHRIKLRYDPTCMRIEDPDSMNLESILKPLNQKELRELYQSDDIVLVKDEEKPSEEEIPTNPLNFVNDIMKEKLKGRDKTV